MSLSCGALLVRKQQRGEPTIGCTLQKLMVLEIEALWLSFKKIKGVYNQGDNLCLLLPQGNRCTYNQRDLSKTTTQVSLLQPKGWIHPLCYNRGGVK